MGAYIATGVTSSGVVQSPKHRARRWSPKFGAAHTHCTFTTGHRRNPQSFSLIIERKIHCSFTFSFPLSGSSWGLPLHRPWKVQCHHHSNVSFSGLLQALRFPYPSSPHPPVLPRWRPPIVANPVNSVMIRCRLRQPELPSEFLWIAPSSVLGPGHPGKGVPTAENLAGRVCCHRLLSRGAFLGFLFPVVVLLLGLQRTGRLRGLLVIL